VLRPFLGDLLLAEEVDADICQAATEVVEPGAILVALDVSVEEAELKAYEAQLTLAEAILARARRASATNSVPEEEVDRARGQRDVSHGQEHDCCKTQWRFHR